MKTLENVLFILFFCLFINLNRTARILGLFPLQIKSHFVMFEPLMKALAERGHEVDVLSHFPQKSSIPRYKDIDVRGTAPVLVNNLTIDAVLQWGYPAHLRKVVMEDMGTDLCKAVLKSDVVQKELINTNTKYDLIITEICGTDCLLAFAHKFQVPSIGVISSVTWSWSNDRFGNPDNPAYIPTNFSPYTDQMNLFERLHHTILLVSMKLLYYSYFSDTNQIIQEVFGPNVLSITDLQSNMSLMLLNTHFSSNSARPTTPNVIEVGGLHIKPSGKIPEDIGTAMNNSKGVILFTFGSMIRPETFSIDKQRALLEAFATLPYTVIWKVEKDKLPGPFPKNIIFVKWVPQVEILDHPKTILFITHGGLMGTQEAIYAGVPMVIMPFYGDQPLNAKTYVQKGIAQLLQYSDLTKENLLKAINTVLTEPRKNIEKISALFHDRPLSALNEAIWWVEYVLRHKGAGHLKPASVDLSWYQLYLFDLAIIVTAALVLLLWLLYLILSAILKIFCGKEIVKTKIN